MTNENYDILRIQLFGDIELCKGPYVLPKLPTRKSAALFATLALNPGRIFSRDTLADMLWSDLTLDKAKKCLRTDLWRIRNMLEPKDAISEPYLLISKNSIGFNNKAVYELDVEQFECQLTKLLYRAPQDLSHDESQTLKNCVDLYHGDLLENYQDDWCVLQREALRIKYLSAMELLMRHYQYRGELDQAIGCGQQLLRHDPLLEHIHLELMHCHCMKGNRPAAIRQYVLCRDLLREELGVSLMAETEKAYRSILAMQYPSNEKLLTYKNESLKTQSLSVINSIDNALTKIHSVENLLENVSRHLHKS